MIPKNILPINCRADFRRWLYENHDKEAECWLAVKRGKTPPSDALWYLDAVEEALCFGWIDSTVKNVDGMALQRFSRRSKKSTWTELNKERCRRLEAIGLMTDSGRDVCPDLSAEFDPSQEIEVLSGKHFLRFLMHSRRIHWRGRISSHSIRSIRG